MEAFLNFAVSSNEIQRTDKMQDKKKWNYYNYYVYATVFPCKMYWSTYCYKKISKRAAIKPKALLGNERR